VPMQANMRIPIMIGLGLVLSGGSASAQLYSQDFNMDDTANWTVNNPALSDITADFYYDYSAIGVPAAPNGTGTRGLKMTANNSADYYTSFFTPQSAPAAQLALCPGQSGVTDAGETSFAWRRVDIEVLGGFATWSIDGLALARVDLSTVTLGGGNLLLAFSDTNAGSSTDPNDFLLNVTLFGWSKSSLRPRLESQAAW